MPFFSVIMPLYNKEAFVLEAVNSVLQQTFADFELLVVDDASTDKSLEMLSEINDNRLKIIRNPQNLNLPKTRNVGIAAANGTVLAFLDSDDKWEPNFLAEIFQMSETFPDQAVYATSYFKWFPQSFRTPNAALNQEARTQISTNFFEKAIGESPYCSSSLAIRKNVLQTLGGYNEAVTFGEDIDLCIRLHANHPLVFNPQPLAWYRQNETGQMTMSSISTKVHTPFSKYEKDFGNVPGLKKYLNFHRYALLMAAIREKNDLVANKYLIEIDMRDLDFKRKLLCVMSRTLVRWALRIQELRNRG
ncbi:glycosyltransferase family 2 protein [Flavobacterium sp.]|uniref:glycosyltransferase family 2 protein n=1 Tax=Flavobacterium sp. TaxID=239 RepID=UPI002626BD3F|nr:glycosyltransferase family 2 protein [Flavobacterium sp.]